MFSIKYNREKAVPHKNKIPLEYFWFSDMYPKMFKILFLVIVGIVVTEAIVCTENFCDMVRCKQVTKDDCTENEVFVKKGGICG
ncbi:uncharacterized protein TNCV_2350911 [Trichonephila clavipes]|uniref:Late nodulin n=1 Tax=Trichonephila clavipes TaxID=2585209 RepID=A0A8X6VPP3_TRICX|nr:uncharacterized protein TNCV_2350911 [Trichonephila clavipes]